MEPVRTTRGQGMPCAGTTHSGKPCGLGWTTRYTDGAFYCRHHGKGKTKVRDSVAGPTLDLPPSSLKTKGDVEKYLRWLLTASYLGKINGSQHAQMLRTVAVWNKLRARMDEELVDVNRTLLLAQMRIIGLLDALYPADDWATPEINDALTQVDGLLGKRQRAELAWLHDNELGRKVIKERGKRDAALAQGIQQREAAGLDDGDLDDDLDDPNYRGAPTQKHQRDVEDS